MEVRSIMQKNIVLCRAEETVNEAIMRMREHRLRCLPVVDDEERLLGAIWTCNILAHLLPAYATTEEMESLRYAPDLGLLEQNYAKLAARPAIEIADRDPLTAEADESLLAVAAAIVHRDTHPEYVFVIGRDRKLLGIVSATDILEWLCSHSQGGGA